MNECEIVRAAGEPKSGLIHEYLRHLKEKKSRSALTLDSYENDLTQLAAFLVTPAQAGAGSDGSCGADTRILSVDPQCARRFVDFLERQYTASTLSRKITSVRGFYSYLSARQKVSENPFANISLQPIQSASPDYLEEAHLEQLFDAICGSDRLAARDRAIVAMLYCTGMRVSELLTLTTDDIDWDSASVRIHTIQRGTRSCTLPAWALHTVERYIERRRTNASESFAQKDVLFVNCDGGPLTARSIRRKLAEYSRRANLPVEATPAVLRHSCAMHLLRRGADTKAVRRQLGHLSVSSMRPYLNCFSGGRIQLAPASEPLEIAAL